MNHETWTVQNHSGKKLGSIKKLIIDSKTRQIAYADIILLETAQIVRIPWNMFAVKSHGILLKATRDEYADLLSHARSAPLDTPITLEVTMTSPGKIRNEKALTEAERSSAADFPSIVGN